MRARIGSFVLMLASAGCGEGSLVMRASSDGELPAIEPITPTPEPEPHAPYPLVLSHGFAGFKTVGRLEYFYGVKTELEKDGHQVFIPLVDPFNSSEVRGEQLIAHVEDILSRTGAKKVMMICHSQGGMDCRYVAHKHPNWVAAVLTLSTPHRGSPVADIATAKLPGPIQMAAGALLEAVGLVIGEGGGDGKAALHQLSSAGAAEFNAKYPDAPGVAYFSVAGRSEKNMADGLCGSDVLAPWTSKWGAHMDPLETALAVAASLVNRSEDPAPPHDGLVTVASAQWGMFLGCVPADHFDEVCQVANDSPGDNNSFDCHAFYRDMANFLVTEGF